MIWRLWNRIIGREYFASQDGETVLVGYRDRLGIIHITEVWTE